MNQNPSLTALLTLNALPRVGPIRIQRLLKHFGSANEILKQSELKLQQVSGVGPEVANIISQWSQHFDPEKELNLCEQEGIQIITADHENWPTNLRNSPDAPILLYVRGEIQSADHSAFAIVGSRRCTHYGQQSTRLFAGALAQAGYTIISGLARGIDTHAHQAALDANGRTIAVLGSGLMHLYPRENTQLAQKIAAGQGAIISEFPLQQAPDKQTFPQRNRIVARWSSGLLVTECPRRSGSLITANMAAEAGRDVYAIPGPIDRPQSEGCNELIRDGAQLVTQPLQILEDCRQGEFAFSSAPSNRESLNATKSVKTERKVAPTLNTKETAIVSALSEGPQTMDALAGACQSPIYEVTTALLTLEMKSLVKQIAGQRYQLL